MSDSHQDPPRLDATPIERVARPFQVFARFKASGAIALFLAAVVALIWANSGAASVYTSLLKTEFEIGYGELRLAKPLILWINDALMGVFFFVVGLEIKREVLAGELTTLRSALLPIAGAIGGMLVPAVLFALINPDGSEARGWGIPMATDIAFALGVLALLGTRIPIGLKVFLTALAIVDDLGAIIVIAIFYTDHVAFPILAIGGGLLGLSLLLNYLGLRNAVVYFVIGTLVWLAFLKSGVHATLAAVLMALTIPARTRIRGEPFLERMTALLARFRSTKMPANRELLTTEQQNVLQHMEHTVDEMTAPLQQLEHALVPYVTFFVVPVFALANAGVSFGTESSGSLTHPVSLGVIVGLLVGKQVGIFGFAWLAVRSGVARLPTGVNWRQIHAVSVLAGIGFTMSLFVAGLAYRDPSFVSSAKLGILVASGIATVVGLFLLWRATKPAQKS
jgi:NhaA family Na+:H+ antiporter